MSSARGSRVSKARPSPLASLLAGSPARRHAGSAGTLASSEPESRLSSRSLRAATIPPGPTVTPLEVVARSPIQTPCSMTIGADLGRPLVAGCSMLSWMATPSALSALSPMSSDCRMRLRTLFVMPLLSPAAAALLVHAQTGVGAEPLRHLYPRPVFNEGVPWIERCGPTGARARAGGRPFSGHSR